MKQPPTRQENIQQLQELTDKEYDKYFWTLFSEEDIYPEKVIFPCFALRR